nr:helix-turn-helix transcriptional regulator [Helcococcus sueciensis]
MIERYNTLKSLLVKKNISQQQLADRINMPRQTFNVKINRYDGRDFSLDEARAISKELNEPIDNFF